MVAFRFIVLAIFCHHLWYRQISNSWWSLSRLLANSHYIINHNKSEYNDASKEHVRANAVPFEGNHAKSFNGNITEHVWGLFGLLFNCLSQSLPDFLRNSRHGHNYLDRVGGSTRCFRTLHYSSALEAVAQSSGREWGCLKPFSNYSRLHADIFPVKDSQLPLFFPKHSYPCHWIQGT